MVAKKLGGLSIREARMANVAQLAKLGSKLVCGSSSMWAQVLKSKYLKNDNLLDNITKPGSSSTWKGICRNFEKVKDGFGWNVGNGRMVYLWFDIWVGREPICLLVENIYPDELLWSVADIIDDNGEWNFSRLHTQLPMDILNRITATPIGNVQLRMWWFGKVVRLECQL